MQEVYITAISKFLPNEPIENDKMEEILGYIDGKPSRARSIVLRNNRIKCRYYALDKEGNPTHNNAKLTHLAILNLLQQAGISAQEIEVLSCGTSTPDQLLPSHAAMVHGLLKNHPMELNANIG